MSARKAFFMATTAIDTGKTLGELSALLARAGARKILTEYERNGDISAVSFTLDVQDREVFFRLPAKWQAVLAAMRNSRTERRFCNEDQARRTAWRIVLRWVQAQLAIVDCGNAETAEVFLPYMQVKADGTTLYELASKNGFSGLGALPAPKGD